MTNWTEDDRKWHDRSMVTRGLVAQTMVELALAAAHTDECSGQHDEISGACIPREEDE